MNGVEQTTTIKPSGDVPLKHWLALFGAILGAFMAILDIQITNGSIREIAGSLSIPIDQSNNIATAYLIAELICIALTSWIARVFSLKRTLIWSVIIFTLSSLACSASWNLLSMVVFRAIQGFASAPLIPLALSMVMRFLPEEKRMIGMALFGLTATFAPTIGPSIGGWLTDNFSWQYLFYINVIPSSVVLILIGMNLEKEPLNIKAFTQINPLSVLLIAMGLGILEYVLENGNNYNWFSSSYITTLSSVTVISLLLFFIVDYFSKYPLVNLRLFAVKNFGIGCINYFFLGVLLYGAVFIVPFYLVIVQHYSALEIGYVFCWQGLPQLVFMPLIPVISKHISSRYLVVMGYLILAASCFVCTTMDHNFSGPQMAISMIIRGIGFPFVVIPLSAVTLRRISANDMDDATSIASIVRNLGGAFGIAIITTLIINGCRMNTKILSSGLSVTNPDGIRWLQHIGKMLIQHGSNAQEAQLQAHSLLLKQIDMNATIIAFNDVFFLLGLILTGCALSILLVFDG